MIDLNYSPVQARLPRPPRVTIDHLPVKGALAATFVKVGEGPPGPTVTDVQFYLDISDGTLYQYDSTGV